MINSLQYMVKRKEGKPITSTFVFNFFKLTDTQLLKEPPVSLTKLKKKINM